jgi:hypothetical protein
MHVHMGAPGSHRKRLWVALMRRSTVWAMATVAVMSAHASRSQATEVGMSRNFGVGFQIGDPTAVTAKLFVGAAHAFDFGLGFGGWGYGWCRDGRGDTYRCGNLNHNFSLHMDYLYEENIVNRGTRLDWYAGFGGRLITSAYGSNELGHDALLLARVPLGLAVTFQRPDFLEAYLEIAPAVVILPPLDFTVDVGLGVRAYF